MVRSIETYFVFPLFGVGGRGRRPIECVLFQFPVGLQIFEELRAIIHDSAPGVPLYRLASPIFPVGHFLTAGAHSAVL